MDSPIEPAILWDAHAERAMMHRAVDLGVAELRRRGVSEEEIAAVLSRMRAPQMSLRAGAAPL